MSVLSRLNLEKMMLRLEGQRKLSVITRYPYQAGVRKAGFDCTGKKLNKQERVHRVT